MEAATISLVSKRSYSFPQIPGGSAQELVLPAIVPTTSARSGVLLVRRYSIAMPSPGTAFSVRLYAAMRGLDDPRSIFLGGILAQVTFAPASTSSPELFLGTIAGPVTTALRPILRFEAVTVGAACDVTIAADLVLRQQ